MKWVKCAIKECDIIISSAGVSVGDWWFLTEVVRSLGEINHYKAVGEARQAVCFGEFAADARKVLYFGLPGNPLSTVVGCINFVRPALWQALRGNRCTSYLTSARDYDGEHQEKCR